MGWDMDHINIDGLVDMEGIRHKGVWGWKKNL